MLKTFFIWLIGLFSGGVLNREKILSARDSQLNMLPVPEWGGVVSLRQLDVKQRMEFLAGIARMQELSASDSLEAANAYFELQCQLLVYSIVDKSGSPCFSESDLQSLVTKSPVVIGRIYDEIVKLNSFNATAVEDEAKN